MNMLLPYMPPTSIPPQVLLSARLGTIARVVGTAIEEWRRFGHQVMHGGTMTQRGHGETDAGYRQRVGLYWRHGVGIANRDGATTVTVKGKRIRPAWSAAFISYVMRTAGVSEIDCPRDQRHMGYIHFAVTNMVRADPDEKYYGHRVHEYAPKVGDLVGYSRTKWVNYQAAVDQDKGESHADIVVYTRQGSIGVIGGNVKDSVTLKILRTDAQGKMADTTYNWFVVLENRLPLT